MKIIIVVYHIGTKRAFTYDEKFQIVENLILNANKPCKYKSIRYYWKPMCKVPAWAGRLRDHEFITYWV